MFQNFPKNHWKALEFSPHKLVWTTLLNYMYFIIFKVWRLVTNFMYFGPIGFNFLFNMIFAYRYCRMLEEGSFRNRTADFFYMILFGCGLMIVSFKLSKKMWNLCLLYFFFIIVMLLSNCLNISRSLWHRTTCIRLW